MSISSRSAWRSPTTTSRSSTSASRTSLSPGHVFASRRSEKTIFSENLLEDGQSRGAPRDGGVPGRRRRARHGGPEDAGVPACGILGDGAVFPPATGLETALCLEPAEIIPAAYQEATTPTSSGAEIHLERRRRRRPWMQRSPRFHLHGSHARGWAQKPWGGVRRGSFTKWTMRLAGVFL
jgi:hypothetical protein